MPAMKLVATFAVALLAISSCPVFALTVPVAEDTSTSTVAAKRVILPSSGAAPTLTVTARQSALVRFNLTDLNVVPAAITPANLKSAILRLYVVNAKSAADVTIHAVTSEWTESFVGKPVPEPTIDDTVLATIPAAELAKRQFVSVDLTAPIAAALQAGNTFGFALETSDPDTRIVFASKEGFAIGQAAELDLDADLSSSDGVGPSLTLSGNLILPKTTATTGILYAGSTTLLHDFGTGNFFAGLGAGNLTMTGSSNAAVGFQALSSDTTGGYNAAIGYQALHANDGGIFNTAAGYLALAANTSGFSNTATGAGALGANTTGNQNTAGSDDALAANTTGSSNTATGYATLFENLTGSNNTATGVAALYANTADNNTATGYFSLYSNTTGSGNLAEGYEALYSNTSGSFNTALGFDALYANLTNARNTAIGYQSLFANGNPQPQYSVDNVGAGYQALYANTSGGENTAVGSQALAFNTTGNNNIAVGYSAGGGIVTGSGNIMIGSSGSNFDNFTIRIGQQNIQTSTYIGGIYGASSGQPGVTVYSDLNGRLFTTGSSRRFKDNIADMAGASDVLLQLRPVTFRYKPAFGPSGVPQFGLIAEEVNAICPDLVAHDASGGIYTVRYDAINAMLLNEFLKEHQRVEDQNAQLARQQETITALEQRLSALESLVHAAANISPAPPAR